jgi:hypothetical protein
MRLIKIHERAFTTHQIRTTAHFINPDHIISVTPDDGLHSHYGNVEPLGSQSLVVFTTGKYYTQESPEEIIALLKTTPTP